MRKASDDNEHLLFLDLLIPWKSLGNPPKLTCVFRYQTEKGWQTSGGFNLLPEDNAKFHKHRQKRIPNAPLLKEAMNEIIRQLVKETKDYPSFSRNQTIVKSLRNKLLGMGKAEEYGEYYKEHFAIAQKCENINDVYRLILIKSIAPKKWRKMMSSEEKEANCLTQLIAVCEKVDMYRMGHQRLEIKELRKETKSQRALTRKLEKELENEKKEKERLKKVLEKYEGKVIREVMNPQNITNETFQIKLGYLKRKKYKLSAFSAVFVKICLTKVAKTREKDNNLFVFNLGILI